MKANEIQHGGQHYKKGGDLQHWDICSRNRIGYLESCATKYVSRWRDKAGMLDLDKAGHYLQKIMEVTVEEGYRPSGVVPHADVVEFKKANGLTDDEYLFCRYMFTWSSLEDLVSADYYLRRIRDEAKRQGF